MVRGFLQEDDLTRNFFYNKNLPQTPVNLELKIKSNLVLSGTDFFVAVFKELGINENVFNDLLTQEGKSFKAGEVIKIINPIPFAVAVTGERLALNLLHLSSSISSYTKQFADLASPYNIKILDTRKTTPGLRLIEKYAVRVGGGHNHRFGQTDTWMVKDNHKTCMGGLKSAVDFFIQQGAYYNNIIVEIHNLQELQEAQSLGIHHLMLDNFTIDQIHQAIKLKQPYNTYEVSGGVNLSNLANYLIPGVDAISTSQLVSPPKVDISLKYKPDK